MLLDTHTFQKLRPLPRKGCGCAPSIRTRELGGGAGRRHLPCWGFAHMSVFMGDSRWGEPGGTRSTP